MRRKPCRGEGKQPGEQGSEDKGGQGRSQAWQRGAKTLQGVKGPKILQAKSLSPGLGLQIPKAKRNRWRALNRSTLSSICI